MNLARYTLGTRIELLNKCCNAMFVGLYGNMNAWYMLLETINSNTNQDAIQ